MAITKVEYFANGSLIGEKTSEPFHEFNWVGTPVGGRTITTKLYVDGSLAATSDPVNITVNESSGGGTVISDPMATDQLLDTNAAAVGAYSLRRVRKDYTGAAIRVRRSSGGEQDFGYIGAELDTQGILNYVGSGTGYVSVIYNQYGGNNAVQTDPALQATIVTNGSLNTKNNKPRLIFNGSAYNLGTGRLGNTGLFASQNEFFTTLNVFSTASGSQGTLLSRAVSEGTDRTFQIYFQGVTATPSMNVRGEISNLSSPGLDTGNTELLISDWNKDRVYSSFSQTDGSIRNSSFVPNGTATENTGQNIEIGARSNGEFLFTGDMMEIIIWDVGLRDNLSPIISNVKSYWGII